jgi:hypothetical protein
MATYQITLTSEGINSGDYYEVTYTTGSIFYPVLTGSPAFLPNVGSDAVVTIPDADTSASYLAFNLNNGVNECTLCDKDVLFVITGSPSPSPSITPTLSVTPSISVTPSVTPTISVTPSVTPSIGTSPTPSVSISPSAPPPSVTPSISVTPSVTPTISVTISVTPSVTPSITVSASTPVYSYYSIKKFDCSDSCAYISPDLVGRSSTPLSTIDGVYYKVGSFTYQIQTEITPAPMSFDIDLDGAPSDADCLTACTL